MQVILLNPIIIPLFSNLEPGHFPQDLNSYPTNDLISSISHYNALPGDILGLKTRNNSMQKKKKNPNSQSLNL